MKKFFMIFVIGMITFIVCNNKVYADVCDKDDIQRLKELANYVEYNYESMEDEGIFNSFYVFIYGLNEEIYLKRDNGDVYYYDGSGNNSYYNKMQDGVLELVVSSKGKKEFEIYSTKCNVLLRKITLDIKNFNLYSLRDECNQLKEYDLEVCDKDYQGQITDEYFDRIVSKYLSHEDKDTDSLFVKIFNFIVSNYIYIMSAVFLIVVVIVLVVRHRKRSVLE